MIKVTKEAMRKDLETKYTDVSIKLFHHVASLLDPRSKSLGFSNEDEKWGTQSDSRHMMLLQSKSEEKVKVNSEPMEPPLHSVRGISAEETAAFGKKESVPRSPEAKKKKLGFFEDFLIVTKVEKGPPLNDIVYEEIHGLSRL